MSDQKNGPWTVHDTRTDYENPWIRVETSNVTHPDGSPGIYGVVRLANLATGVLPIADDGTTWLVGQHRFPFNAYSWELPEGGGDPKISPWDSAARELKEETGLVAAQHLPLGTWQLSNSVTDEVAYGFLAWELEEGPVSPEPSEALAVKRLPFRQLVRDIREGRVQDAFTVLMVYGALDKAREGHLPDAICERILAT